MATIPDWARQFIEYNPSKAGASGYDSSGYAIPFVDANGELSFSPSTQRSGDTYARLLPGMSWGYDPEGNPLTGPRYGEDGSPILMDGEGNRIAEEVPYWDPQGLYRTVAQQMGAGYAEPLQNVQNFYNRSEIPGAGISYDQFLNRQYVNPRVVDVPGMGQFVTADSKNSFDWGLGDRSSFLQTLMTKILPTFAMAGGLESLIGSAAGGGAAAGMPGMAEGYGAIEASMGTPIGEVGSLAGGATTTALPAAAIPTGVPITGSEFSLATPGAGIGGVGTAGTGLQVPGAAATGVGAGSGSLGLNLGTGGLIAETAAGLGAGALTPGLSALETFGQGASTPTPSGTPAPTTPGTPTTPNPVADAADNIYNPTNPTNPIPNTTTPTPKSFWQTLEEALGLPVNALSGAATAATTNPLLKSLGLLGDALLSNSNTNRLEDAIRAASEQADPFRSQRGFYQGLLKQSYTDPNFLQNNPTLSGIRNMAVNDVSRAMAAQGYNQSTNTLYNIGQRLQDEGGKFTLGFQNQLGQLAGAGISPQESARLSMQGTQLANQGRSQTATSLGDFARELPNVLKGFGLT